MGKHSFLKSSLIIAAAATTTLAFVPKVNAATAPGVAFDTHIQQKGWIESYGAVDSLPGAVFGGTTGQSLRLEAVNIRMLNKPANVKLSYRTHVQTYGWQDWVDEGAQAGTTGESKRMEAIELSVEGAEDYVVRYRAHVQTYGWQPWIEAKNTRALGSDAPSKGGFAGTVGESKRMEALEIVFVSKTDNDLLTQKENAIAQLLNKFPPTKYTINKEDYDKAMEAAKKEIYSSTVSNLQTNLDKQLAGSTGSAFENVKDDETQKEEAKKLKDAATKDGGNIDNLLEGVKREPMGFDSDNRGEYIQNAQIADAVTAAKKAINDSTVYTDKEVEDLIKEQEKTLFEQIKSAVKGLIEEDYATTNANATKDGDVVVLKADYEKAIEDLEKMKVSSTPAPADYTNLVMVHNGIFKQEQTLKSVRDKLVEGITTLAEDADGLAKQLHTNDTTASMSQILGFVVNESSSTTYANITSVAKAIENGKINIAKASYPAAEDVAKNAKLEIVSALKTYMDDLIKAITNNPSTNRTGKSITAGAVAAAAKYNSLKSTTDVEDIKDLVDAFNDEIMARVE